MEKIIDRVRKMECLYDRLRETVKNEPGKINNDPGNEKMMRELLCYYEGEWQRDFEADEKGLLPQDLKRGVLSEDGLHNLLSDLREAFIREKNSSRETLLRRLSFALILSAPYVLALMLVPRTLLMAGAGFAFYLIMLISGVICTVTLSRLKPPAHTLFQASALIKLAHIPFYVSVFIFGLFTFPFSVALLPLIALTEYALLLASGLPGMTALFGLLKKDRKAARIILLICQFIFCLDVISALILWASSSKRA